MNHICALYRRRNRTRVINSYSLRGLSDYIVTRTTTPIISVSVHMHMKNNRLKMCMCHSLTKTSVLMLTGFTCSETIVFRCETTVRNIIVNASCYGDVSQMI